MTKTLMEWARELSQEEMRELIAEHDTVSSRLSLENFIAQKKGEQAKQPETFEGKQKAAYYQKQELLAQYYREREEMSKRFTKPNEHKLLQEKYREMGLQI